VEEITLKRLKESNYYHPVITDVIQDYKIMLEITIDGLNSTEIGYNTVWDAEMCKWASRYFVEGLELVKQKVKEKGIKCRLITEVNTENEGFLNTLPFLEIRHLEGLRGNFGIREEMDTWHLCFTKRMTNFYRHTLAILKSLQRNKCNCLKNCGV